MDNANHQRHSTRPLQSCSAIDSIHQFRHITAISFFVAVALSKADSSYGSETGHTACAAAACHLSAGYALSRNSLFTDKIERAAATGHMSDVEVTPTVTRD